MQRHVVIGDHSQGYWQLQAQGLVHAGGEFRVMAVATQGQVAKELAFTQGHACVLAAFANQAGQVGMVKWRLGLGLGAGVLLEDVDSAHFLPALNSWSSIRRSLQGVFAGLIAGKPAPTGTAPTFITASILWEPACQRLGQPARHRARSQTFCRSPFGSKNTEDTISASITLPSACGE